MRKALADASLIEQLEETVARILPVVVDQADDALDDAVVKPDFASEPDERRFTVGSDLDEADAEIDLDIEHDDQGAYLWGYLVTRRGHADAEYRSIGSPDRDADTAALAGALISELSEVIRAAHAAGQTVRLYHYAATERRHLERLGSDAASLLAVATDLHAFVKGRFSSATGYGLKSLAPAAGATWRTDRLNGETAADWISRARAGDEQAWTELVHYNEDDVRATLALRHYLRAPGSSYLHSR